MMGIEVTVIKLSVGTRQLNGSWYLGADNSPRKCLNKVRAS